MAGCVSTALAGGGTPTCSSVRRMAPGEVGGELLVGDLEHRRAGQQFPPVGVVVGQAIARDGAARRTSSAGPRLPPRRRCCRRATTASAWRARATPPGARRRRVGPTRSAGESTRQAPPPQWAEPLEVVPHELGAEDAVRGSPHPRARSMLGEPEMPASDEYGGGSGAAAAPTSACASASSRPPGSPPARGARRSPAPPRSTPRDDPRRPSPSAPRTAACCRCEASRRRGTRCR